MRISRYFGVCIWSCVVLVVCCALPVRAETTARPNILLIVIDDMGYSDIGPFGAEIRTPNSSSREALPWKRNTRPADERVKQFGLLRDAGRQTGPAACTRLSWGPLLIVRPAGGADLP